MEKRMNTSCNLVVGASIFLALAAGCAQSKTAPVTRTMTMDELRVEGRVPAIKPEGVIVLRDKRRGNGGAGPAPYGYVRTLGNAVPDWSPIAPAGTFQTWTFVGPRPMSSEYWSYEGNAGGRITGIAPHATNANICYIATASGGAWKTTNGGTNWTPLTDELSILNCGAIAVSATNPNLVFLGTGDYVAGSNGDGIFRSLDAGATWERVATAAQVGNRISKMFVDPTNANIIHAATSEGTFRSDDGGNTWPIRLIIDSSSMSVANASTILVGARGNGVWKSTNSGAGYTKLTGGLPASGFSHVDVAISQSNPLIAYAGFVNGGGILGMWRTADGGTTWTQKTATPNYPNPQGAYNTYICVDPLNPNTIYVGGVDPRYATVGISKSTNGGDTWTEVSGNSTGVHPDHHTMVFGPGPTIWEGNDGGIYKSTNGGTNWINLNSTLAVGQIYQIALHPTSVERMLGGTQDNGTPERTTASMTWPQLQTGDGGWSVFDPSTSTRRYTTYVYLDITRWSNSSGVNITGPWSSDAVNFIAPLIRDPNSATTLLGGTTRVWRTTNSTAGTPTWTALSGGSIAGTGGTLNAIAVAKTSSNTIYAGSSTGRVQVTQNLTTWVDRSAGLVNGDVSDICISPTAAGTAYVSYFNTTGNRVFRTDDFGANWTNMTGTLPAGAGITALAVDFGAPNPVMYAGTGSGIFVSLNGGRNWVKDDASFPNVNVGDLQIYNNQRVIVAGTYGRGAWRANLLPICPADFNGDGSTDFFDYLDFVDAFSSEDPAADFNNSGTIDFFDYLDFVDAYSAGCL